MVLIAGNTQLERIGIKLRDRDQKKEERRLVDTRKRLSQAATKFVDVVRGENVGNTGAARMIG